MQCLYLFKRIGLVIISTRLSAFYYLFDFRGALRYNLMNEMIFDVNAFGFLMIHTIINQMYGILAITKHYNISIILLQTNIRNQTF